MQEHNFGSLPVSRHWLWYHLGSLKLRIAPRPSSHQQDADAVQETEMY